VLLSSDPDNHVLKALLPRFRLVHARLQTKPGKFAHNLEEWNIYGSNRIGVCAFEIWDLKTILKKRGREVKMKRLVAHEQTVRNGQEEGMKPILLE
jgi:hypothetical protein